MPPESLILLVLVAGMFFLLVNRTRRQQREAQNLQSRIQVGSRIMTTAGLHATVVEIEDDVLTLETGPGQRSRWDRRAVGQLLSDEAEAADSDEPEGTAEHDDRSVQHPTPDGPPERA